jgi:carboxymethylenebutenolidase
MKTGMQQLETPVGALPVYGALPEGNAKGGLIVIHEVWGLLDHTKDVADRFAKAGYIAVAPDLMSGTAIEELVGPELFKDFSDPERRSAVQVEFRKIMGPLQSPEFSEKTIARLRALYTWLKQQPETGGKVGVVGFCFGGTYSFELAATEPDLVAAVPFYGHASEDATKLAAISCPVMAFYGDQDANLMEQLPKLKSAMKMAKVTFSDTVYPGAGHAFFNDQNPLTYNEAAAKDAWQKTVQFLDKCFSVGE